MMESLLICRATSEDYMLHLAEALAPILRAGDVLRLQGPLGAGKTVFARGIIRALMSGKEEVPSPTYPLVQMYGTAIAPIWHLDLYRLDKSDDIWELGFEEAQEAAISLVEWPEKAEEYMPAGALVVEIKPVEDSARTVTFLSDAKALQEWRRRFESLQKEVRELKIEH